MSTQVVLKTEAEQIRKGALEALVNSDQLLNKTYLANLEQYQLKSLNDSSPEKINVYTDVRIFQIERIVLENKQSVLESLTAAYTALGAAGYTVFMLLNSDGKETTLYLGTRGASKKSLGKNAGDLLEQTFKGHFSGSRLTNMTGNIVEELLENITNYNPASNATAVSAVSGVSSLSVEEREHFMQGLERFIDAAEGREYQALILADPVPSSQLNTIRLGYENAATQLSPLLKQSLSFGQNESDSVGLSISKGLSESLGVSLGLTETKGTSESLTETKGSSESTSKTYTTGTSESTSSPTLGAVATKAGATVAAIGGGLAFVTGGVSLIASGAIASIGGAVAMAFNKSKTEGTSTSTSTGTTTGSTYSSGTTTGSTYSSGTSKTQSKTDSQSYTDTKSDTHTHGSSKQITLESLDKSIEQMLKKIDHQLERIDEAQRYGAWNSAAYFISDSTAASESLASIFFGLMRGNSSNSENFAISTWKSAASKSALAWLGNLNHPRIETPFGDSMPISYLTPATLVSGKEMAIQLSLPRNSTSTVTVIDAQAFGRKIQNVNESFSDSDTERVIKLGHIRHLWVDLPQEVKLKVDNLTSHMFVSGSTGSGKSNTIYEILNQLSDYQIPFMVIEPAKGEYKNIFGQREDVTVLGTNPKHTDLLKINPFQFPNEIHVLEHIDRLVEIFNVCWPMYAAMPAVLKDAMLTAYEQCGWDLVNSEYNGENVFYPTFIDLLESLEQVIAQSAFSDEVKSNYVGSLVTRVKSLTNGLNGQIFSSREIDNNLLFDSNVIVDLSRIGSQETKALIMGILVMRLSEHRMSKGEMNQPLKHITVLEEAHNILKRTSTEQSTEGSNVTGKAVEMLSNAIAEMRTYGEGFIIADQSPNAVDISAIRNTNTKIIMRLPDEQDRRLAGKAAAVTDEQLEEIAKLPRGVAVVHQSDWLEPVLCSINKFEGTEEKYLKPAIEKNFSIKDGKQLIASFLLSKHLKHPISFEPERIKEALIEVPMPFETRNEINKAVVKYASGLEPDIWQNENFHKLSNVLVTSLNLRSDVRNLVQSALGKHKIDELSYTLQILLRNHLGEHDKSLIEAAEHCAFKDLSLHAIEYKTVFEAWQELKAGVLG